MLALRNALMVFDLWAFHLPSNLAVWLPLEWSCFSVIIWFLELFIEALRILRGFISWWFLWVRWRIVDVWLCLSSHWFNAASVLRSPQIFRSIKPQMVLEGRLGSESNRLVRAPASKATATWPAAGLGSPVQCLRPSGLLFSYVFKLQCDDELHISLDGYIR